MVTATTATATVTVGNGNMNCCVCAGSCNHVGNHSYCEAHGGKPYNGLTWTTTGVVYHPEAKPTCGCQGRHLCSYHEGFTDGVNHMTDVYTKRLALYERLYEAEKAFHRSASRAKAEPLLRAVLNAMDDIAEWRGDAK